MYTFFNTNTGQCIVFIDRFLSLIGAMYILFYWSFFIINRGQCIFLLTFFVINTGQCILFIELFLSLIEVNKYFLFIFFIINPVLVLKNIYIYIYIHWPVLMRKRSIKNFLSSIVGEVNKTVFFFHKHIWSLKHAKLRYF